MMNRTEPVRYDVLAFSVASACFVLPNKVKPKYVAYVRLKIAHDYNWEAGAKECLVFFWELTEDIGAKVFF